MAGRPQESLYTQSFYERARTPPPAHPAPNNAGLVLLVMVLLAIVAALAFVGPEIVGHIRRIAYCMDHAQEAAC